MLETRRVEHGAHHFLHHRIGAGDRSPVRELHIDNDIALILIGYQAAGEPLESVATERHQPGVQQKCEAGLTHDGAYRSGVTVAGALERPVEAQKKAPDAILDQSTEESAGWFLVPEQQCAQSRTEG